MNQSELVNKPLNQSAGAKRGKMRTGKSRLVLVLLLIDRESGTRYFSKSQTVAMQLRNQFQNSVDNRSKT